ncbi:MAG: SH3 domain-containing protein, partial [Candidatus Muiribacteriaceae bacterium]
MINILTKGLLVILAAILLAVTTAADPAAQNPDNPFPGVPGGNVTPDNPDFQLLYPTIQFVEIYNTELFSTPYSKDQKVLAKLQPETPVLVLGKLGEYYKVKTTVKNLDGEYPNGQTVLFEVEGWIFNFKATKNMLIEVGEYNPIATVSVDGANLRQGPSLDTEIITVLPKGKDMKIIGRDGNFYKVELNLDNLDGVYLGG